jgi:branched-chain amino acid aminotransferase/4-amino-4-deoxychorismate lyase
MASKSAEFAPWLGVFETLRVVSGAALFVEEHYAELRRAAEALGLPADFNPVVAARELPRATSGRWRWITTADRTWTMYTMEEPQAPAPIAMAVSPLRVGSANWDARFKTLGYLTHAQARRIATTPEVVLLNEHGHVASAASANIFWRRGDRLFTPAHEAGCRRGVVRKFVLGQEKVEAGHFPLNNLLEADEIFLTNSMRGIISVVSVESRAGLQTGMADRLRRIYDEKIAEGLADRRT